MGCSSLKGQERRGVFVSVMAAVMTVGGVYNNSAYVANRIDLVSSRNIEME